MFLCFCRVLLSRFPFFFFFCADLGSLRVEFRGQLKRPTAPVTAPFWFTALDSETTSPPFLATEDEEQYMVWLEYHLVPRVHPRYGDHLGFPR